MLLSFLCKHFHYTSQVIISSEPAKINHKKSKNVIKFQKNFKYISKKFRFLFENGIHLQLFKIIFGQKQSLILKAVDRGWDQAATSDHRST